MQLQLLIECGLGHSYTNAVFMFSVARILHANKWYEENGYTDRISKDPLENIAYDMRRYIGKDDTKSWIYKLYLPNEKLIQDTDMYDSSVYVHGRVKAGNIKCIGYYKLARFVKDGVERVGLAYYLGNGQRVESIEEMLKADVEMTNIDLISNDEMKLRQYTRNVNNMIPAKYYETIINCYGKERQERDEIIKNCSQNGESVKQCVLKLLLKFRNGSDNVYKLLGMKAPYESPKFKYFKKYVKPTATRVDKLDDGYKIDDIFDEAERSNKQYSEDNDYSFDDDDVDYSNAEEDLYEDDD